MKCVLASIQRTRIKHIVLSIGLASSLLGAFVLAGWHMQTEPADSTGGLGFAPMQANSAFCFLLAGLALILAFTGQKKFAFWCGILVALSGALTVAQDFYGIDFGIDELLIKNDAVAVGVHPGRMNPNLSICFLLIGFGIACLAHSKKARRKSLVAIHLALGALGISIVAVYGYLTGIEAAYGWGRNAQMAPLSSLGVLLVAVALLTWGWNEYELGKARVHELSRAVVTLSATSVFFVAIVSASFGLIPYYSELEEGLQRRFSRQLEQRQLILDKGLLELRLVSEELANSRQSVSLLRRCSLKTIRPELCREQNLEIITKLSQGKPGIRGISRIAKNGDIIAQVGISFSEEKLKTFDAKGARYSFLGPFSDKSEDYIVLVSTVLGFSDELLARDVFIVPLGYFAEAFRTSTSLGEKVNASLVMVADGKRRKFSMSEATGRFVATEIADTNYRSALLRNDNGEMFNSYSPLVTTTVPVRDTDWSLLVSIEASQLAETRDEKFWKLARAVFVLAIFGTAMIFIVAQSIISRELQLQERLKGVADSLDSELQLKRESETKIQAALREREVLLKEIHHRVKNNLQIISSIFSLQRRRIQDPKIRELLDESSHRVQSMALLHETLYQSKDLSTVEMKAYLSRIISSIQSSANDKKAANVEIELCAEDVTFEIDQAIPCGLIVNELVTNSLKHAFKANTGSVKKVNVKLVKKDDSTVLLRVHDNGSDFPEDINVETTSSLGLRLVSILTEQLVGKLTFSSGKDGTEFLVIFPAIS